MKTSIISTTRLAFVIPVYNRKDYLFEALETILAQELAPGWTLDVVVVDDGSSDGVADDPRMPRGRPNFHLISQKNSERGAARNRGANFAVSSLHADWLQFFDSDDVLVSRSLFKVTEVLSGVHPDVVAAYSAIQTWSDGQRSEQTISAPAPGASGDLSSALFRQVILPLGATVLRASSFTALGGFLESREMSGSEDFQFLFRLGLSGNVVFVPVTSVLYRRHDRNTRPTQYLRSVSLVMANLKTSVEAHWPGPSGEKVYKKLLRLGDLCKIGALSANGLEGSALQCLGLCFANSPSIIVDRRFLILCLIVVKNLLARVFQLKRRTTS